MNTIASKGTKNIFPSQNCSFLGLQSSKYLGKKTQGPLSNEPIEYSFLKDHLSVFNLSMESKKLDLVSQDDVKNAGG